MEIVQNENIIDNPIPAILDTLDSFDSENLYIIRAKRSLVDKLLLAEDIFDNCQGDSEKLKYYKTEQFPLIYSAFARISKFSSLKEIDNEENAQIFITTCQSSCRIVDRFIKWNARKKTTYDIIKERLSLVVNMSKKIKRLVSRSMRKYWFKFSITEKRY